MNLARLASAAALCLTVSAACHADVVVNVGDLSLQAGSSGYVPVYISGTASDSLGVTNFGFQITTSGATQLQFTNSPSPTSDPTFSNSSYVFYGNSGDLAYSLNLGTAGQTATPNDTFSGGDFTADFISNVILSSTKQLLAELPVTAITSLPPAANDTFTISLVPGDSTFSDSSSPPNYIPFTSTSGTVTITEAESVPEPSSLVLLGGMGGAALLGCWWRRRRAAAGKVADKDSAAVTLDG